MTRYKPLLSDGSKLHLKWAGILSLPYDPRNWEIDNQNKVPPLPKISRKIRKGSFSSRSSARATTILFKKWRKAVERNGTHSNTLTELHWRTFTFAPKHQVTLRFSTQCIHATRSESSSVVNERLTSASQTREERRVLLKHVSCPRAVVHYPRSSTVIRGEILCETSPFVPRRDLVFVWRGIGKFCGANSPRVCTDTHRERERERERDDNDGHGVTSCTVYDVRWIIGRDGHSPLSDHIPSGETGPWLQEWKPWKTAVDFRPFRSRRA